MRYKGCYKVLPVAMWTWRQTRTKQSRMFAICITWWISCVPRTATNVMKKSLMTRYLNMCHAKTLPSYKSSTANWQMLTSFLTPLANAPIFSTPSLMFNYFYIFSKVDYLRRSTSDSEGRKMATIIRCLFKQLVNSSLLFNMTWSGANRIQSVSKTLNIA